MNEGWIAVWRKLRAHQFWRQPRRFSKAEAWLDILMDTAFADHNMLIGNTIIPIKRGQAPISQREKAKIWGWARDSVRKFMTLLVKLEMVVHEVVQGPDGGRTILTVRNYEWYQSFLECGDNQKPGHELGHELGHAPATTQAIHNKGNKGEGAAPSVTSGASPASTAKGQVTPHISNGRGRSNKKVPDGYQEAVDFWFLEFERTKGSKPYWTAEEGKHLKALLTAHGSAKVKAVMRHMLTRTAIRFIREGYKYSIRTLATAWNELWSEYQARAAAEGEEIQA